PSAGLLVNQLGAGDMSRFQLPIRSVNHLAVALCALSLVSGCGQSVSTLPVPCMVPVAGRVTVDGKPLSLPNQPDRDGATAQGLVMFMPQEVPGRTDPLLATGAVDGEGKYHLMTDGKPGAPAGRYKVVVVVGATFTVNEEGRPVYKPRKTDAFDEK